MSTYLKFLSKNKLYAADTFFYILLYDKRI